MQFSDFFGKNPETPAPYTSDANIDATAAFATLIFIVEDDPVFAKALQHTLLQDSTADVRLFSSAAELLANLYLNPDIVTLDHNLSDAKGIDILKTIGQYNSEIKVVIVSAQEDLEIVVQYYRHGAKDYIIKRHNAFLEVATSISNLKQTISLRKELERLKSFISSRQKYNSLIGESPALLQSLRLVEKVEKTDVTVLVSGESGTGKEMIGKLIHYNSNRKNFPYLAVNLAALPSDLIESELFGHEKGAFTGADQKRIGKFEEVNRGTLFLDEISEIPLSTQLKLLRVIQERTITRLGSNKEIMIDIRLIAATNKSLTQALKEGSFRQDLFYRLQGFPINLPALRDRGNDIILLSNHFLKGFCEKNMMAQKSLVTDSVKKLLLYDWPGNVRELKSTIERAVLLSESNSIQPDDIMFII